MTEELQICNTSVLRKTIHELVHDYPGKFDLLAVTEFECDKNVPVIAYDMDKQILSFNPTICEATQYTRGCLAFAGILINNASEYCKLPEGYNIYAWNLAVHTKVIHDLQNIGEFTLPDDSIDSIVEMDKSLPLHERYDKFKEIVLEFEFEKDEKDDSASN